MHAPKVVFRTVFDQERGKDRVPDPMMVQVANCHKGTVNYFMALSGITHSLAAMTFVTIFLHILITRVVA